MSVLHLLVLVLYNIMDVDCQSVYYCKLLFTQHKTAAREAVNKILESRSKSKSNHFLICSSASSRHWKIQKNTVYSQKLKIKIPNCDPHAPSNKKLPIPKCAPTIMFVSLI